MQHVLNLVFDNVSKCGTVMYGMWIRVLQIT